MGVRASAAGKVGEAPRGSISCVSPKRNCSLEQVRGFKRETVFIRVTGWFPPTLPPHFWIFTSPSAIRFIIARECVLSGVTVFSAAGRGGRRQQNRRSRSDCKWTRTLGRSPSSPLAEFIRKGLCANSLRKKSIPVRPVNRGELG